MSSSVPGDEQCKALTESGQRCSRPAQDDGLCYQHGPDDETIEDAAADGGDSGDETTEDGSGDESGNAGGTDDAEAGGNGTTTASGGQETTMTASEGEIEAENIEQVRENVQRVAEGVVGHPLDGIPSIDAAEEGWRVAVEVVEREGVPDTQDILGRYELELEEDGTVTGYRRTHRYRRDDMDHDV